MRCSTAFSRPNNVISANEQPLVHQSSNSVTNKLEYFADWFTGKTRRKGDGASNTGKEPSPPPHDLHIGPTNSADESTLATSIVSVHSSSSNPSGILYLQPEFAVFTQSLAECNIHELIRQPTGVDRNEWIANNIVAFYNHVNALYNAMAEYCTANSCPSMTGPQNSSYYWIDERGKKVKCSASQYVDNSLLFIQRTLDDDSIFPTRLDQPFPLSFDTLIRKMVRLLFHAVAHLYAVHYRQLISVQLHPHLNSFFLHFVLFLITSNLISSDNSTVNTCSSGLGSPPMSLPGQTDTRELRCELESLDVLYQLLAQQWRLAYAQACAQKRKTTSNNNA